MGAVFRVAWLCLFGAGAMLAAGAADAKVTEKTTYYQISGKTGVEMLYDMNRRGPRHGFLTKAIAQTQFKNKMRGDLVYSNGVCRTRGGGFDLAITYVYPQPQGTLSPVMARRWKAFQATNVQHERMHGTIAKKMAASVDQKLKSFSMKDDENCRRAIAALGREIDRIFVDYNRTQTEFDKREHRTGGPVEKSILALIKDGSGVSKQAPRVAARPAPVIFHPSR